MSYVDSHLLPNENVLYRTKLHWKIFLVPGIISVLCLLFSVALFRTNSAGIGELLLIAACCLLIILFLKRQSSEFAVTNKRIIIKLGVISTRSIELLLPKVETLSVNQGLLGKLLGYGDITVTGTGGTKEIFKAVQEPLKLRNAVQAATTSAS